MGGKKGESGGSGEPGQSREEVERAHKAQEARWRAVREAQQRQAAADAEIIKFLTERGIKVPPRKMFREWTRYPDMNQARALREQALANDKKEAREESEIGRPYRDLFRQEYAANINRPNIQNIQQVQQPNQMPQNMPMMPFMANRPRYRNTQQESIPENPETSYSQIPEYYDEGENKAPDYMHNIRGRMHIMEPIANNPETPYSEEPRYFDESQKFAKGGAVMNPALIELANQYQDQGQQQMQPQAMPQPQQAPMNNPIMSGAQQGIQSARDSMRMNDEDRGKALGLAIMHFGRNMSKPTIAEEGWNGTLARINQASGPAVDAYLDYEKQVADRNIFAMKIDEERRIARAKEELAQKELDELKRYHTGLMGKATKDERMYELAQEKTEALQEQYPGAIALEAMTRKEQTDVGNELRALSTKGPTYVKLLDKVRELKNIHNKYPNLSDTMAAAWYPEGKGAIKTAMRSGLNKDERFALERAETLTNQILQNKIDSITGKMPTDILKKVIGSTLPQNRTHLGKSSLAALEDMEKDFEPMIDYIGKTPAMLSKRFFIPRAIESLEDINKNYAEQQAVNAAPAMPQQGGLSPEEIDEMQQLEAQLGINNGQ